MKHLRCLTPLLFLLAAVVWSFAASAPPSGTVLPVQLSTNLDSHLKPGKQIHATIMQEVPLPGGDKIPEHSKLVGHVVSSAPNEVVFQFDSLRVRGHAIPIAVSLRAIAGPLNVEEAQLPTNAVDLGTSSDDWNTNQIGGEVAIRGSQLMDANAVVGKALLEGGALAPLMSSPRGCSGGEIQQALWVFSSSACGVYGYPELTIVHAGRTEPVGRIALRSNGKLLIRGGSGLMLRVVGETPRT